MKTRKLFLSIFCLGALMLSACSGGSKPASSSSASSGSASSEAGSSSSAPGSSEAHTHSYDELGVCSCGAYNGNEDWELNYGAMVHLDNGQILLERLPIHDNTDYGFFFDNPWPTLNVIEATIEIWYKSSSKWEQVAELYGDASGNQLIQVGESVDDYLYFKVYFEGTAEDYEYDTVGLWELNEHAFDENNAFYGMEMNTSHFKSTDGFNLNDPKYKINGKYYVGIPTTLGHAYQLSIEGIGEGDVLKAFQQHGTHIEELTPVHTSSTDPFELVYTAIANETMVFEITSSKDPAALSTCDLSHYEPATIGSETSVGELTTNEERNFVFVLNAGTQYRYALHGYMMSADVAITLVYGNSIYEIDSSGSLESRTAAMTQDGGLFFRVRPGAALTAAASFLVSIAS